MFNKRYITIGLLLYLLAIIFTLPAELFSKQVNNIHPRLKVNGLKGSLWHGQIQQLTINHQSLNHITWDIQPLALLLGRLQLTLSYADAKNSIQFSLARGFGGTLQILGVEGQLEPAFLQSFTPYPVPAFHGSMIFEELDIVFEGKRPQQAQGKLEWRGAVVELGQKVALGTLLLSLEDTDKGIEAVLTEQSGKLSGQATMLLTEDGRYKIEARFTPSDKDRHLARHLSLLLVKGADGSYGRSFTGQLR